jgi:hypothetical protein
MATSEERVKILKMVQEGKLSAEQAVELLTVLDSPSNQPGGIPPVPPIPPLSARPGRWFRVRITDTDTGKVRVNVRMPVSMLNAGMKMGMRFSPEVQGLNPDELIEAIRTGEAGQIVDVYDEEDGEHVEVFIE